MSDLEARSAPPLAVLPAHQRPDHDPYEIYLASLDSAESKRTMRGALDRIARMQTGDAEATGAWQPWWLLRYEHTIQIRAALIDYRSDRHPNGYSPTHINKHLIALRRVLRVCWRMGLMTAEEYQRAADIENVTGSRELAGRDIHRDELTAMLHICSRIEGPEGIRDAAIVAVLFSTGLRRAEMAAIMLERYNPGERSIKIVGKRNKERYVYITPTAVPPLDRWLNLLDVRRGPMFRPIHKTGTIRDVAMAPRSIGYVVDRVRRAAGLPPLATHDFRRTFTGDLLDAGVDLATAQKLLGHASPTTTAQYDRRPGRAARAAVDLLTLPSPESLRDKDDHSPTEGAGE